MSSLLYTTARAVSMELKNMDDARAFVQSERTDQSLDQADLAERANVSRQAISRFENGGDIKLSTLFSLIRSLNGQLEAATSSSPKQQSRGRPDFGV